MILRDPVGSLRASLVEAAKDADISGSLVVVPEAFNIRKASLNPDRELDLSIRTAITKISAEFRIVLVAGLVEENDA